METSAFIEALTEALLISTAQAFAIVLFFRVMFSAVPEIPSVIRYRLWYSSLVLVFGLFIYTLLSMYSQKVSEGLISGIPLSAGDESQPTSWLAKLNAWKMEYAGFIASFYFLGVGIQFLSLSIAWFKARSLGRAEPVLQDPLWTMKLHSLREKLRILKHVGLHISEKVKVPITAGFIRPIIILPVAMVARLSPEQVESILIHELAHIKRNDYLWNIAQKAMESILFFNPFVWLIVKEIHREREYCCDEIVVSKTSDPLTYANALLQLEVQIKSNELTMAATGTDRYPLFDRIKKISGMKNPDPSPKNGLIVLATILCVGLSLAVALPQHKKDPASIQKEDRINENWQIISQQSTRTEPVSKPETSGLHRSTSATEIIVERDTQQFSKPIQKSHREQLQKHAEQIAKHALEQAKHQELIQKHNEEINKYFQSDEWKNMQKELAEHSAATAQAAMAAESFPVPPVTPELPLIPEKQGKLHRQIEKLQRKFESPEWQAKQLELHKKITVLTRKITSADWDKKAEEIELKVEELVKGLDEMP